MGNPAEETFCHPNQNFKKPSAPCVSANRATLCGLTHSSNPLNLTSRGYASFRKCAREIFIFALTHSSNPLNLTSRGYASFRKCAREIFIFARKIFGAESGWSHLTFWVSVLANQSTSLQGIHQHPALAGCHRAPRRHEPLQRFPSPKTVKTVEIQRLGLHPAKAGC